MLYGLFIFFLVSAAGFVWACRRAHDDGDTAEGLIYLLASVLSVVFAAFAGAFLITEAHAKTTVREGPGVVIIENDDGVAIVDALGVEIKKTADGQLYYQTMIAISAPKGSQPVVVYGAVLRGQCLAKRGTMLLLDVGTGMVVAKGDYSPELTAGGSEASMIGEAVCAAGEKKPRGPLA
jgi:hypothetical protein